MEIQITVLSIPEKAQNYWQETRLGWRFEGAREPRGFENQPGFAISFLSPVFLLPLVSERKSIFHREGHALTFPHFLQGFVTSAFLSEFYLHFLHLSGTFPFSHKYA